MFTRIFCCTVLTKNIEMLEAKRVIFLVGILKLYLRWMNVIDFFFLSFQIQLDIIITYPVLSVEDWARKFNE
jgi:hypothetical protein